MKKIHSFLSYVNVIYVVVMHFKKTVTLEELFLYHLCQFLDISCWNFLLEITFQIIYTS